MVRRVASPLVFLSLFLVACVGSKEAAVVSYVETVQSVAERMSETSTMFDTLMKTQENPLVWSDEEKAEISKTIDTLTELQSETKAMSVPASFTAIHPLLTQSIGEMLAAVTIIRDLTVDPTLATLEKAKEMTATAESGERLSTQYIEQLEVILNEQYPAMMKE